MTIPASVTERSAPHRSRCRPLKPRPWPKTVIGYPAAGGVPLGNRHIEVDVVGRRRDVAGHLAGSKTALRPVAEVVGSEAADRDRGDRRRRRRADVRGELFRRPRGRCRSPGPESAILEVRLRRLQLAGAELTDDGGQIVRRRLGGEACRRWRSVGRDAETRRAGDRAPALNAGLPAGSAPASRRRSAARQIGIAAHAVGRRHRARRW